MAKRSPLRTILEDPKSSMRETDNFLATLWRKVLLELKMSPMAKPGVDPDQFKKLVEQWCVEQERIMDKSKVSTARNNLIKALAGRTLTWTRLTEGIKILNSLKTFKKIRLELHFYMDDDTAQVIGMNWLESQESLHVSPRPPHNIVTHELRPGAMAYIGGRYTLGGFKDCPWNGRTVVWAGRSNVRMTPTFFDSWIELPEGLAHPKRPDVPEWLFIGVTE